MKLNFLDFQTSNNNVHANMGEHGFKKNLETNIHLNRNSFRTRPRSQYHLHSLAFSSHTWPGTDTTGNSGHFFSAILAKCPELPVEAKIGGLFLNLSFLEGFFACFYCYGSLTWFF